MLLRIRINFYIENTARGECFVLLLFALLMDFLGLKARFFLANL